MPRLASPSPLHSTPLHQTPETKLCSYLTNPHTILFTNLLIYVRTWLKKRPQRPPHPPTPPTSIQQLQHAQPAPILRHDLASPALLPHIQTSAYILTHSLTYLHTNLLTRLPHFSHLHHFQIYPIHQRNHTARHQAPSLH
ncbi:uncharacterized protein K452DRAFT_136592 [Aplosporella prunicola CBS 121167]|uniref:Uncharacterized protein n=1 Tax=Aplosporella prunicola CBS 121167 TaxID=1176127 RepID=A0A6A6BM79_9PEZI|nr:uncharacterized protein K452DRAFT_136592 [Aplosporella prunicola CBS 121167]KAF2145229.1 hypothetical protein K452DRAFT_136592 [Aplosporella prunicola CBS 121167]